jgi:hypothetical protein
MPMTPAAAKKYKPRRTPGSSDDVVYSGSKQAAIDAAKEVKEAAKNEADYNSSLTTENKAKGGSVGSASKRADGIAIRGKTRA